MKLTGLSLKDCSETQSIALFDIIAFALISGETNVIEFEQDEPIETGGALTSDDPDVTFIGKEVAGDNDLGTFVVNEDGTWTFVANSPYDELADGEQIQDTTPQYKLLMEVSKSLQSLLLVLMMRL